MVSGSDAVRQLSSSYLTVFAQSWSLHTHRWRLDHVSGRCTENNQPSLARPHYRPIGLGFQARPWLWSVAVCDKNVLNC